MDPWRFGLNAKTTILYIFPLIIQPFVWYYGDFQYHHNCNGIENPHIYISGLYPDSRFIFKNVKKDKKFSSRVFQNLKFLLNLPNSAIFIHFIIYNFESKNNY